MNDFLEEDLDKFESYVERGKIAHAVLIFLDSFLLEQRARIMGMLESGNDRETDSFIADLRALKRLENALKQAINIGEYAKEVLDNGINESNDSDEE